MAGFLLIHGAMHGGWCFDPVADILRAKGHTVVAPDLPGMGGDAETLASVTLDDWTSFALGHLKVLRAQIGDAPLVLAGHSRGGLNLSAAAEADPGAMDALVYICALMLPAGLQPDMLPQILPAGEEMRQYTVTAPGGGMMIDPAHAGQFFAQLSPPHLVEAAMKRLVAEPTGPLSTPPSVTPKRWGSVPRTYIECLHDRTVPIEYQRRMLELSPGTRTVTLEADHSPFFSATEALADALIAAAVR